MPITVTPRTLMELPGVGPVVAARILADVGDVSGSPTGNRFASWTGTAPFDALSGRQIRHRLSRAEPEDEPHAAHRRGPQVGFDTEGLRYYRRQRAEGKTRLEAMRCLDRRISEAVYRQLLADAYRRRANIRVGRLPPRGQGRKLMLLPRGRLGRSNGHVRGP